VRRVLLTEDRLPEAEAGPERRLDTMADEHCGRCEAHGCGGPCGDDTGVDRRRFRVDLSRYAIGVTGLAMGGGVAVRRAIAGAPEPLTNSLGMQLVEVPAGPFRMGSEDADDEKPVHDVTLSAAFRIAVCETSNADYRAFVAATGRSEPGVAVESKKRVKPWRGRMFTADEQPVTCVTWDDAVAFCAWLSEKEGARYRLPTEAEWEYAARAGTQTRFYWGDEPAGREKAYFAEKWPEETKQAEDYQPTSWDLYTTVSVRCEERNPLGLCHVAGNVWEWTADWHGPYSAEAQTDPIGPAEGTQKVTRGGSRFHQSRVATASVRRPMPPGSCCRNRGFRVVLEA
jgi:sulfatase modifying factor 1